MRRTNQSNGEVLVSDLPAVLLITAALLFLVVELTGALVVAHTDVRVPRVLQYGWISRKVERRALLIEVPFLVLLLGTGEVFVVLVLADPNSTIPDRLLAAGELIAAAAWLADLGRLVTRGRT